MTNFNTKTLINYLPMPEDHRIDLLAKYDSLERTEQLKVSDLLWNAFAAEYDFLLKSNFEKITSDPNFKPDPKESPYQKAVKLTNRELESGVLRASEKSELTHVRKSMETIVSEISASKKQNTS